MTRLQPLVLLALLAAPGWAQDKSQPAPSSSRPASHATSISGAGAISEGVYRNPSFGFSYKLPYGWVDRTREMHDDSPNASNPLPPSPCCSLPSSSGRRKPPPTRL